MSSTSILAIAGLSLLVGFLAGLLVGAKNNARVTDAKDKFVAFDQGINEIVKEKVDGK